MLEVIGAPFEDEASASDMHQQAALNCGWAGPEFIQYILDTGDQAILDEYQDVVTEGARPGRNQERQPCGSPWRP